MVRHKSRSRSRDRKTNRDRSRSRSRDRKREKDRSSRHSHQKSSSGTSNRNNKSKSRSRSPRPLPGRGRESVGGKSSSHRDRSSDSDESTNDRYGLTLGGGNLIRAKQASMKLGGGEKVVDDKAPFILDPKELEGKSPEEIEMLKIMGFAGFDSTKGKHVDGACNAFAVNIQQKRKYRQYMNRKGGFNKPLDPVA